MKNTKKGTVVALLAFVLANISPNVFAENYGISYTGGAPLSESNVTVSKELIDGLTPLIKSVNREKTVYSNSNKWENGYHLASTQECLPIKYFRVSDTKTISQSDNLKVFITNDQYTIEVSFNGTGVENYGSDGKDYAVYMNDNWVDGMTAVFSDSECKNVASNIKVINLENDAGLFVKTNIKLHKKNSDAVFTTDELYFGITDIDAAQSYKILNSNNLMTKSNMFAASTNNLQGDDPDATLKNMYVSSGNYIYSQYDESADPTTVISSNRANVFVKVNKDVQQDGLDVVFGYKKGAASTVLYYTKQYAVKYESDEGGEVTGIKKEDVISGEKPAGSEQTSKEGYEFTNWIADKAVTLDDGTTILAGKPLSMDQIKKVVVNQDLVFTAIHEKPDIAVPNTGASTENTETITAASVSIIGILIGALIIRFLPRLNHKKVNFD